MMTSPTSESGGRAATPRCGTSLRRGARRSPDLHIEVEEEIACGDTAVHRVTARGTHLGKFSPGIGPGRVLDAMPPTGRSFEADQMHIHRGPRRQDHRARRDPQRSAHAQPARPAARHQTSRRGILAHPADPDPRPSAWGSMKAVYPLGSSRDESARLQRRAPCGGEAGAFWGCSDYAGPARNRDTL